MEMAEFPVSKPLHLCIQVVLSSEQGLPLPRCLCRAIQFSSWLEPVGATITKTAAHRMPGAVCLVMKQWKNEVIQYHSMVPIREVS